jgi:hypothetical protein
MANDITIKDGSSYAIKVKTTETNGIHVPHHNIDNLQGIITSLQSILTELQQNAELPISGSVTITGTPTVNTGLSQSLTNSQLRATPVDVTGNFYQTTQPVSVVSLPLPTDAATSILQTTANTSLESLNIKTPALGQALVSASTPVVLPASQIATLTPPTSVGITGTLPPITAVSLPLPSGAATEAKQPALGIAGASSTDVITVQGIAGGVAQPVTISTLPALATGTNTIGAISNSFFAATQSGAWNITNISGTVSLPTGASTSALQTTGNTSLSNIDTKTPALGQALAAASIPVVLPAVQLTALTPPTTVGVNSLPALSTGSNAIGSITNTSFGISGTLPAFTNTPTFNIGTAPIIAVTGNFYQATQPVSLSTNTPTLQASSAIVGKVGIDQTTPGTTNKVSIGNDGTVAISGNLPAFAATPTFNIGTAPSLTFTNTSFTANAGSDLNTSALALESGGNLAGINTKLPSNLTVSATRLLVDGSGVTQPVSMTSAPLGLAWESSALVTRPPNVAAYTANDVYGGVFEIQNIGASGGFIFIESIDIIFNIIAVPAGMSSFTVYLYGVTPSSAIADNLPFSISSGDRASILNPRGIVLSASLAQGGGGSVVAEVRNINQLFKLTGTSLFGYVVTNGAFTPAANSENFTIRVRSFAP